MDSPPLGLWQWLAHTATAAVLAMGAWVFRKQDKRLDVMEEKLARYLTRQELVDYIETATQERRDMHGDNKLEFERLNRRIDRLHERRNNDTD